MGLARAATAGSRREGMQPGPMRNAYLDALGGPMADPEAFLRALAKRWATDPQYAEKVLAIYRAHRLFTLDQQGEDR